MLKLIECYICSFCKNIYEKKDLGSKGLCTNDCCMYCTCIKCGKNTNNNQSFDFNTYCRQCFCKEAIKREKEDIEDHVKYLHELEEELEKLNESQINSSL